MEDTELTQRFIDALHDMTEDERNSHLEHIDTAFGRITCVIGSLKGARSDYPTQLVDHVQMSQTEPVLDRASWIESTLYTGCVTTKADKT